MSAHVRSDQSPGSQVFRALGPVTEDRVDVAICRTHFDGTDLVIELAVELLYPKLQHFSPPPLLRQRIPLKQFRKAAKAWHRKVDAKVTQQPKQAALPVEGL